jgi:hypothetical protein
MAKGAFSRRARYFIVEDTSTEDGFDAYPVEVPYRTKQRVRELKALLDIMYESFEQNPAPEECAQAECDLFTKLLDEVFEKKYQGPGRPWGREKDNG